MTEDVAAQIGDDALAQPVDVVEARRAGEGEDQTDDDQHREVLVDEHAVVGAEPEVDHAAHGHRDDQHGEGRNNEGNAGECELELVAAEIRPQRQQRAKLGSLLLGLVVLPLRGVHPV